MSVSGPTDENVPVPGSAVPSDGDDPLPEADDAPQVSDEQQPDGEIHDAPEPQPTEYAYPTVLGTRPCVYCGRPVPQGGETSPPVRFCTDNGGACADAAAERRRRDQDSPGLAGQ